MGNIDRRRPNVFPSRTPGEGIQKEMAGEARGDASLQGGIDLYWETAAALNSTESYPPT